MHIALTTQVRNGWQHGPHLPSSQCAANPMLLFFSADFGGGLEYCDIFVGGVATTERVMNMEGGGILNTPENYDSSRWGLKSTTPVFRSDPQPPTPTPWPAFYARTRTHAADQSPY